MKYGVDRALEDEADRLIRRSLRNVTSYEDKKDVLTAWKTTDRLRREVLAPSGSPDPSSRSGQFHRRANTRQTWLNSRDGVASSLVNRCPDPLPDTRQSWQDGWDITSIQ
jgi:ribosome modulation factor